MTHRRRFMVSDRIIKPKLWNTIQNKNIKNWPAIFHIFKNSVKLNGSHLTWIRRDATVQYWAVKQQTDKVIKKWQISDQKVIKIEPVYSFWNPLLEVPSKSHINYSFHIFLLRFTQDFVPVYTVSYGKGLYFGSKWLRNTWETFTERDTRIGLRVPGIKLWILNVNQFLNW